MKNTPSNLSLFILGVFLAVVVGLASFSKQATAEDAATSSDEPHSLADVAESCPSKKAIVISLAEGSDITEKLTVTLGMNTYSVVINPGVQAPMPLFHYMKGSDYEPTMQVELELGEVYTQCLGPDVLINSIGHLSIKDGQGREAKLDARENDTNAREVRWEFGGAMMPVEYNNASSMAVMSQQVWQFGLVIETADVRDRGAELLLRIAETGGRTFPFAHNFDAELYEGNKNRTSFSNMKYGFARCWVPVKEGQTRTLTFSAWPNESKEKIASCTIELQSGDRKVARLVAGERGWESTDRCALSWENTHRDGITWPGDASFASFRDYRSNAASWPTINTNGDITCEW